MPRRLFIAALLARNYARCSQLSHWQGIMPLLFNNHTTGKELRPYVVHSCPTGKELCRYCLITTSLARSYAAQIYSQLPYWQGIMPPLFNNHTMARTYAAQIVRTELHYWQGTTPTVHSCPRSLEVTFNNILLRIWSLSRMCHTMILHCIAQLNSVYHRIILSVYRD